MSQKVCRIHGMTLDEDNVWCFTVLVSVDGIDTLCDYCLSERHNDEKEAFATRGSPMSIGDSSS
jgi:hypothetical protein